MLAALIVHNPADFDGMTFANELDSGNREYLKQVHRNVELYMERDMRRSYMGERVEVIEITGDVAKTDIGYVLVGDMECE